MAHHLNTFAAFLFNALILITYIQPVVECYSAFVGNRTKELENINLIQPMVEFVVSFSGWPTIYRKMLSVVAENPGSIQSMVELWCGYIRGLVVNVYNQY